MAARLNNRHQDMVRAKIQASQLVNRLQDEALGKIQLTDGQRDSAKYLLTQAIGKPMQSVTVDSTVRHARDMSDADLADIAAGRRPRASNAASGEKEPSAVH